MDLWGALLFLIAHVPAGFRGVCPWGILYHHCTETKNQAPPEGANKTFKTASQPVPLVLTILNTKFKCFQADLNVQHHPKSL